MSNYLHNPSFEDGWHDLDAETQVPAAWCYRYAKPDGWYEAFWLGDGKWDQSYVKTDLPNPYEDNPWSAFVKPEMVHKSRAALPDAERDLFVLDGDYTLKIFKGTGTWFAGLLQAVYLEPGVYTFTPRVYADLVKEYRDGQKVWADDPEGRDGLLRFTLNGHPYDFHSLIPGVWNNDLSLTFAADGDTVVGIEIMCPFALANSGVFLDGWTLVEDDAPTPTWGAPREDYARAYNVIPPNVTEAQAVAIFLEGWQRSKETAGGSYDDAGVGALGDRTANLYGIDADLRETFTDWYAEYYPGVKVVFKPMPGDPGEPTEPTEPDPPVESLRCPITLHLQTPVDGWKAFVSDVKPAWVKLFQFELARDVKSLSPETKTLVRFHVSDYLQYRDDPDKARAAKAYLDRFWESVVVNRDWLDCIEGQNETIATGDYQGTINAVAFAVALSDEVAARCAGWSKPVAACLLNVAVGNPQHGLEETYLLPAARAAVRNGHYMGYHPYWPDTPTQCFLEGADIWEHYAGRWTAWDETFAAEGVKPRYLLTEAGPIGTILTAEGKPGHLLPGDGWRSPMCCNGDWGRTLDEIVRFRELMDEWNATHGGRAEAAMLFTSGVGINWEQFLYTRGEMEDMAVWLG